MRKLYKTFSFFRLIPKHSQWICLCLTFALTVHSCMVWHELLQGLKTWRRKEAAGNPAAPDEHFWPNKTVWTEKRRKQLIVKDFNNTCNVNVLVLWGCSALSPQRHEMGQRSSVFIARLTPPSTLLLGPWEREHAFVGSHTCVLPRKKGCLHSL